MRGIPSFNEEAVREAILNAVSHRDYRHAGSVFVRQFPRRIEIVSPGGFPEGITAENLLTEQFPRNRRLAEALGRCGFVERAGQGADKIFETCIRDGKALPDFTDTTPSKVALTLHGEVRDKQFVRFLERVTAESGLSFGINDLLVLSHVHDEKPIPSRLDAHVKLLVQAGILERLSRGKLLLSRRFYQFVGRAGEYTRRRGLDHETNKALLATHIEQAGEAGAPMEELTQVLPSKSRDQVKRLLQELRLEGRVHARGARRGARWHAGPPPSGPLGDQPPKRSRRSAQ
jgi:ATP-dependent DNA helicase RecG